MSVLLTFFTPAEHTNVCMHTVLSAVQHTAFIVRRVDINYAAVKQNFLQAEPASTTCGGQKLFRPNTNTNSITQLFYHEKCAALAVRQ